MANILSVDPASLVFSIRVVVHPKLQILREHEDAAANYWHNILVLEIFGQKWVYDPTREQFGLDYGRTLISEEEYFSTYVCLEEGLGEPAPMIIPIGHDLRQIFEEKYDDWAEEMGCVDDQFWRDALEHGTVPEIVFKIEKLGASIKTCVDEVTRDGPERCE